MFAPSPKSPSFEHPPSDGLFLPGRDEGLALLAPVAPLWREVPRARISSILLTEDPHVGEAWLKEERRSRRRRQMKTGFELNVQLAVVDQIRFRAGFSAISGRWLLNGAGGQRLWTKYYRKLRRLNDNRPQRAGFGGHFEGAQALDVAPKLFSGDATHLPIVLDARNLFNYYHFMAETFCHLALVAERPDLKGDILIHCKHTAPKPFVLDFIRAIFPELAQRVSFPGTSKRYERAVTPFVPNYFLFQSGSGEAQRLRRALPESPFWSETLPEGPTQRSLSRNGYWRSHRKLRERALSAARAIDSDALPRRVWIGRRAEGKRDRSMGAEARIVEALRARGFQAVCFEDFTPLEQVALMNSAEVVVSYHGAGFTNLLYAGQETKVLELGTLQSGMRRWSDFISLAHVAGCDYTLGICDSDQGPASERRDISGGLQHVAISETGIDRLLAHIDGMLNER